MEPMDCLVISGRHAVVGAALSVHPYESPAFMTFPVDSSLPDGPGPL